MADFRASSELFISSRATDRELFGNLESLAQELRSFRFICVRHGESQDNAIGLASGQRDIGLTPLGWQQAQEIQIPNIQEVSWVFASDLLRARQTAAIVARSSPELKPIYLDTRIREISLGDLEGKKISSLPVEILLDERFPNGESYTNLFFRICSFVHCVLTFKHSCDAQGDCVLFGHGGAWRMLRSLFEPTTNTDQLFQNLLTNAGVKVYHSHSLKIPDIWLSRVPK